MEEVLRQDTHGFAREVNLHQRVHQVLPVTVKPENLPHPIHERIVHCRHQKSEKTPNVSSKKDQTYEMSSNLCQDLLWGRSSAL